MRSQWGGDSSGNDQIWVIRADGTGRRQITKGLANHDEPALSPSGRQIAFSADPYPEANDWEGSLNQETSDIYVINVDGSHLRRLTRSPAFESEPSWSPDGRRILYSAGAREGALYHIWVMHPDGTHKERLTPKRRPDSPESCAKFSPDGRRIAYCRGGRIWVMKADGSGQQALSRNTYGTDWDPSWSSDGTQIAYDSSRETNKALQSPHFWEIWVMRVDGTHQRRLTNNTLDDETPTWSPDGDWLAFASMRPAGPKTRKHIWIMSPTGTRLRRLTRVSDGFPPGTVDFLRPADFSPSWGRLP